MRRKDKERQGDEFKDYVFQHAELIYVAFQDGEYPYCLPFNFGREGNSIFIHSAREGHKLDCIKKNPHVSFALDCDVKIDREKYTTYYKSLCGKGIATLVEGHEEKAKALSLINKHYQALCPDPAPESATSRVAIWKIDIIEITGKESRGKEKPSAS